MDKPNDPIGIIQGLDLLIQLRQIQLSQKQKLRPNQLLARNRLVASYLIGFLCSFQG
jgi:hypothetical protein